MSNITSDSQAWSILARHARDDIDSLRLLELCLDTNRVSSLVTVFNNGEENNNRGTFVVDFSRQQMTLETLNSLLHFACVRKCMNFIRDMPYSISSQNNNNADGRSVLALRAPRGSVILSNNKTTDPSQQRKKLSSYEKKRGKNVCYSVHAEWKRIQDLSDKYRQGQLRGSTGAIIRDIVVVGSGVAMHAIRFVYEALLQDTKGDQGATLASARRTFVGVPTNFSSQTHYRLRLISSIDTVAISKQLKDLDPASTLVITLALTGQEETGLASRLLKNWLLQRLSTASRNSELIFSKHMLLVTGNERLYQASRSESVLLLPSIARNSEPFCTTTAMTLLPLSIVFGWSLIEEEFLSGAHAMDNHVIESNPRQNIPLLLALVDLWNDAFLAQAEGGRLLQPFGEAFVGYGDFVAALESQVCSGVGIQKQENNGASYSTVNKKRPSCGWVVLDRGDVYDRCLFQSQRHISAEMLLTLDPTTLQTRQMGLKANDILSHHDSLICSLLGQADELALSHNRPSTLILVGRLDAFTCGQLVALAEHRAMLKAQLWDMNPTTVTHAIPTSINPSASQQFKGGAMLRTQRSDSLRDDLFKLIQKMKVAGNDEDEVMPEGLNLSTATLLSNYAGRTHALRVNDS